jgi:cation diffusion facilitator CzcD-associated flavoprotein CzcO
MIKPELDVVIIGAGISGMYQLYRLRKLGLRVRVFEAGDDVGGTWYWNRYPGARFDSESYSYGYSFSKELLEEWNWKEHFSAQPETLGYLNHVADKFDLRKDIEFKARIMSATYQEDDNYWLVETEGGAKVQARFLVTAVGPISTPVMPDIEGVESFLGESHHTGYWPHEPVDFSGKRVGVIGTGATGVQVIQEVAKTAKHLTVFQRRPNFCTPLHNSPIDDETQKKIHESYPEIFEQCAQSHGSFLHKADSRNALDVSREVREEFYEKLYSEPGFGIWMGNFRDILVDEKANATITEFISNKIRQRVVDPVVAEHLVPKDHGFGTRRVPMETNYYEVYNQDNVLLVNVQDTPIERITPKGIKTTDEEYELDFIIYATGFDAITGAFDKIEIRGQDGLTLKEKWADGPRTCLGLQVAGFPNMMTLVGPHNAATFCNIPRCIEHNVEWVTGLFEYMLEHDHDRVAPTIEAEDEWTKHVHTTAEGMLFANVDSWFMGINRNLPHKRKRSFLLYAGGAPAYREKCDGVAAAGYSGFEFG